MPRSFGTCSSGSHPKLHTCPGPGPCPAHPPAEPPLPTRSTQWVPQTTYPTGPRDISNSSLAPHPTRGPNNLPPLNSVSSQGERLLLYFPTPNLSCVRNYQTPCKTKSLPHALSDYFSPEHNISPFLLSSPTALRPGLHFLRLGPEHPAKVASPWEGRRSWGPNGDVKV